MNDQTQKVTGVATSAPMLATMGTGIAVALPSNANATVQVTGTFAFAQGEVAPLNQIARSIVSASQVFMVERGYWQPKRRKDVQNCTSERCARAKTAHLFACMIYIQAYLDG